MIKGANGPWQARPGASFSYSLEKVLQGDQSKIVNFGLSGGPGSGQEEKIVTKWRGEYRFRVLSITFRGLGI